MSRSAFIISLALHAGLVCLAAWQTSTSGRIGPGVSGADALFIASPASGTFLADSVPAASPEPASQLRFAESALTPPAPDWGFPALPLSTVAVAPPQLPVAIAAPPAIPRTEVNSCGINHGRAKRRISTRARGNAITRGGAESVEGRSGHGSAGYSPPQFRFRYKPNYPEEARAQRLEGTVLLLVSINAAGRVTSANILSGCGYGVLDRAALTAVHAWRFDPARQEGVAVAAQVEVPVRFHFEDRAVAQKVLGRIPPNP